MNVIESWRLCVLYKVLGWVSVFNIFYYDYEKYHKVQILDMLKFKRFNGECI
jgi:hypothetical protein